MHVRATDDALTVRPRRVTAFLPLRFVFDNTRGSRRSTFRVAGLPLVQLPGGLKATQRSPGERPGRLRISAGRGRVAILRVKAGG